MNSINIIIAILYWAIIAIAIFHVVMDNRQPSKTMAWALVIFFIPVAGIILYLFFGINTRKERSVNQRTLDEMSIRSMLNFVGQQELRIPDKHRQMIDLFVNENLSQPFKDNQFTILTDGYQFILSLLQDIGRAHHHIHLNFYIFDDDALGYLIADALIDKAREGVEVRLIYDDVGCWNVKSRFFDRMTAAGVNAVPFLPVHFPSFTSKVNYRNHRKEIVIDGITGYIGGMNIAQRYVQGTRQQPWRDTMLRMTGGVVYSLQRAFLIDWHFVTRSLISDRKYYPDTLPAEHNHCLTQIVTSGPSAPYPEIMQGYVRAILSAKRYVYIETPYFLPNEPVLFAIKTAALAGIDVRIICPLHSDARFTEIASRSYLREVAEAGAKVFLYKAGFMHSKLMICDDSLSTCGSTNVDFRSFENNFETNVFIYDEGMALRLKKIFMDDMKQSLQLADLPRRMHPHFAARVWESFTRMFSPLL